MSQVRNRSHPGNMRGRRRPGNGVCRTEWLECPISPHLPPDTPEIGNLGGESISQHEFLSRLGLVRPGGILSRLVTIANVMRREGKPTALLSAHAFAVEGHGPPCPPLEATTLSVETRATGRLPFQCLRSRPCRRARFAPASSTHLSFGTRVTASAVQGPKKGPRNAFIFNCWREEIGFHSVFVSTQTD
jgi:hypothetical protein